MNGNLANCPSTVRRSVLWWWICTGTYSLHTALPKATQGIAMCDAASLTLLSCPPEKDRDPHATNIFTRVNHRERGMEGNYSF